MTVTVKFEGGRELEKALNDLPKATQRNVLQRGLKKVAEPVANEWRARAPDDPRTGPPDLKTSIVVGPSSKLTGRQKKDAKKEGRYLAEIHVGTSDPAGIFQEFGTVNHSAQPSGRPAWDANKEKALADLGKFLWEEIEKARARLAKKAAKGI